MKPLASRFAKAVNRGLGRRGPVLRDRSHLHVLRTVREVRNAIRHVLNDARRHRIKAGRAPAVASVAALVQQGAGWILVLGGDTSRAGLIETGRRFQRVGLRARECGVGIHPMTQILEEEPWRSAIAGELGLAVPPQFILRAGSVDPYPPPVSLRRPVPAFVERAGERSVRRDRGLRATLPLYDPGGTRA